MVDHARRPSETCVLESVEASHSSHGVAGDIACDLGIHLPPIRMDSQCKYGLLAQGQVSYGCAVLRDGEEGSDGSTNACLVEMILRFDFDRIWTEWYISR